MLNVRYLLDEKYIKYNQIECYVRKLNLVQIGVKKLNTNDKLLKKYFTYTYTNFFSDRKKKF